MKQLNCDTVVIGAGSAGLEAFKSACDRGAVCILVDSGPLGTSAQLNGELPLSLLMQAGIAVHGFKALDSLGIEASNTSSFNLNKVLDSVRTVRSRATSEVLSFLYKIPEERRLHGQAVFLDRNNLTVGDDYRISFKTAVIATGATPLVSYEQSRIEGILTTSDFFELDSPPSSAAVFGSSLWGLQIGQALSYMGIDVAVFGQSNLWNLTDENVLSVASSMLSERFNLYLDSFITSIEKDDDGYSVYYVDDHNFENYLHMQKLIAATGRVPNCYGMNLAEIGVKLTHTGCIQTDGLTMQTTVPNIFAAGNVCHDIQNTSLSIQEGRYAGINAATFPKFTYKAPSVRLSIVHTDPVLAIAGLTLNEMKERARTLGKLFITTTIRLHLGQYRSQREDGGILCMYTDCETHKVMGAEICAFDGEHIAEILALAIHNGATVENLASFNFYHLSVESTITEASQEALRTLKAN